MAKKDWELFPAPDPWKSDAANEYWVATRFPWLYWAFALFFGTLAIIGSVPFLLLMTLPFVFFGLLVFYLGYSKATDGIETWYIPMPVNVELFHAIDAAVEFELKTKGYPYLKAQSDSGLVDKETGLPLGRYFFLDRFVDPARSPHDSISGMPGLAIHIYYRLAGKTQTPFFHFYLEGIQPANHEHALILQKDIVAALETIDYTKYKDIHEKRANPQ
jgi:hypothetical protein